MELREIAWIIDCKPQSEFVEGCEVLCPECNKWSSHLLWKESEVECEDCGSHSALKCPECSEDIDTVYVKHLQVRALKEQDNG